MNLGKWPLGKCFFIIDRKAPATLVETPRLNGVLPGCFFLPNFLWGEESGFNVRSNKRDSENPLLHKASM